MGLFPGVSSGLSPGFSSGFLLAGLPFSICICYNEHKFNTFLQSQFAGEWQNTANQTAFRQRMKRKKMEQIKISVRTLVEFILRSGDIDNRRGKPAQKEAMQEGSRIHRKIQRSMDSSYQPEVSLKLERDYGDYTLLIEGRADGVITQNGKVAIDEIKGIYQDVSLLEAPFAVHLAQAKCYAYMVAFQQSLPEISVQMTYCSLETEEIRRFTQTYSFSEISGWFEGLLASYRKWADFQYHARRERMHSIQSLQFPFPYREGQKKLASDVYRTLKRQKILFIQAPTGTGKTLTTIFPAVKAAGEGLADKIFYLTAKTITRTVAQEAFALLQGQGYLGRIIVITAKEKLCLCGEMDCNPLHCPYAKGHYDRVNDAVFSLLQKERCITRELLLQQAEEFCVCPFELCLDAALWSDDIICDYNYVFDPNIYLKRFFAEGVKGDSVFLVDEAHNLVERGRDMYSAILYKEDFLAVKKIMKGHSRKCAQSLERCNRHLLQLKRECETYRLLDQIDAFTFSLMQLCAAFEDFFLEERGLSEKKEVMEFYWNLRHFLNMQARLDENYVIYTEHEPNGHFKLKLYCVNPAKNLQECLDRGKSAIFFSATLLPIQYYKKLLSARDDNYAVYAQTIFRPEQQLLAIARDVSSRYTRRTDSEFQKIAEYIYQAVKVKQGNYMVFFPSYKMMGQVSEKFLGKKKDADAIECLFQESGMDERERESFLEAFSKKRENTLIGFCVMGGIFSEGIDLKKESLIGVVIVGTGLPQISSERDILRQYYDNREGAGFDYAFRYPGMNKVLQAAGRVIRTVEDKGVVLLLDGRFLELEWQYLFPREWKSFQAVALPQVQELLEGFWE